MQEKYFAGIYDYYVHYYIVIPYTNNVNCRLVLAVKKVLLLTFGLFPQLFPTEIAESTISVATFIDMK
jgi:hypothetical protein